MEIRPTESALRLCLYLSYIRSMSIVGQALAREFPTEAQWQTVRASPEFIEDLNHFTTILEDVKLQGMELAAREITDPAELIKFIGQQYDIAAESLEDFATKYRIPVEDLVYVLIHG